MNAWVSMPRDGRYSALDPVPPNINSVRGLACLLVVALHVVGDAASNGLHLPMTSGWHYAMVSIEFLRIPLFTALSGYLYAGHRVTGADFPRFWTKKFRRLAVPLVFATVVIWWLRGYAQTEHTPLMHALFYEFEHLWFLQALLVLFAVVSVSDAFFRFGDVGLALGGLAVVMFDQMGLTVTTFLGLAGALYLAPYFLFGIILRGRPAWLRDRRSGVLALGIIIIVLTSQQLGLNGLANPVTLLQLPAALAGMSGVVFLLQRFPMSGFFGRIGHYAYTIYLWHVVATAGTRDLFIRVGVTAIPVQFICGLLAGVAAPVVLYHVARRIPLLSMAVTGERWIGTAGKVSAVVQRPTAARSPVG